MHDVVSGNKAGALHSTLRGAAGHKEDDGGKGEDECNDGDGAGAEEMLKE
jgi:hypothetical protein